MIDNLFKKAVGFGVATALVASLATAPAMANSDAPVCKAEDKALVKNLTKQYGVSTLDFTDSSRACLEKFASGSSHKYLVYVAKSDSQAWRDATVEAAKIDKQEGIPVAVAFAPDSDGDPKTADTIVYANGVKRDIASEIVKEGYTVEIVTAVDPQTPINNIHKTGHNVYSQYIALPPLALN